MVNLAEIDRRFRPSDRQPGINNEGRGGIEQFFRSAGNYLQNTKNRGRRYFEASDPDNKGFFRLPNQYDADMARFVGNTGASVGEFMHDLYQLPFEAAGQAAGLDVGSGQGFGDIPYFLGQSISPNRDENRRVTEEALNEVIGNIPNYMDSTALIEDPRFKDYLQNVKGYNIGENFGPRNFYEMMIEPNVQSFDDFEETFIPDNEYVVKNDDYFNTVYDKYLESIAPEEQRLWNEIVNPFRDYNAISAIVNLSDQLGISEQLAGSMLMGEGDDYDLGLLNDLAGESFTPFEYQTEEGQEFFEDPVMELGASIPTFAIGQNLINKGLRSNNLIRKTVGQAFPLSAKMDTSIPLNYNPFRTTPSTINKRSLRIPGLSSPAFRSAAQTYGLMSLADQAGFGVDEFGRRIIKD